MISSPFDTQVLLMVGPVPITTPVVTTWGIILLLSVGSWLITRRLALKPSRAQAALELVVDMFSVQIRETMGVAPAPYLPLIGTFFLYLLVANWSSLIPGVEPPTDVIEKRSGLTVDHADSRIPTVPPTTTQHKQPITRDSKVMGVQLPVWS